MAMNWHRDDLVEHFVAALDKAQIEHAPFSHLYAVDLFPEDVYGHLVEMLPHVQGYKSLNHRDAMRSAFRCGAPGRGGCELSCP